MVSRAHAHVVRGAGQCGCRHGRQRSGIVVLIGIHVGVGVGVLLLLDRDVDMRHGPTFAQLESLELPRALEMGNLKPVRIDFLGFLLLLLLFLRRSLGELWARITHTKAAPQRHEWR